MTMDFITGLAISVKTTIVTVTMLTVTMVKPKSNGDWAY